MCHKGLEAARSRSTDQNDGNDGEKEEDHAQPNGDIKEQSFNTSPHVVSGAARAASTEAAQPCSPALKDDHNYQRDRHDQHGNIEI
jgi:hypothetical protein